MNLFSSATLVFSIAFALRLILLCYGIYQDGHSALKYTDIDYYVFTDAARAVSRGQSPYDRATYRYTPLLAWILLPTAWSDRNGWWFHSGKALFAASDLVAGWLILVLLKRQGLEKSRALTYASVCWLLNPMVANISTRGSSEGLLCVLVMANLWAFETQKIALAGALLGLCVHFKIYPFIYGSSMLWTLVISQPAAAAQGTSVLQKLVQLFSNRTLATLVVTSLATFITLNVLMYTIYGGAFFEHTFFHHLTRIDHRHNFSPYNTLLYLSSSRVPNHVSPWKGVGVGVSSSASFSFERLAFLPQLLLSTLFIPIACTGISTGIDRGSKSKDSFQSLAPTLLAQTLAFVTFNKVCTSQYFLWYLIFLPLYLPHSSLIADKRLGFTALGFWVAGQVLWLQQGFELEFLGRSTFVPGLWVAGILFFAVNCWILGIIVGDIIVSRRNVVGVSNTTIVEKGRKKK